MLYVQQSLNPNEEIVRIGEFPWWYTFNAILWIGFGLFFAALVLYAGYYWQVTQTIGQYVPGTQIWNAKESGYWDAAIEYSGGTFSMVQSIPTIIKIAAFVAFIIGLLAFIQMMLIKYTTEICLTTDRLILKRGVIARNVEEISIDRIEGVDVRQGILGRMMNFGHVEVRGMGVGEIRLPIIDEPVGFRKSIERSRSLKRGGKDDI
jgi:membrane protein YdbS with pleckstrin-like domain